MRDAKQEARSIRRFAEGTPYSEMGLLPPTKEKNFWYVTANISQNYPWSAGGWIGSPIESWTAGYLRSKGATVKAIPLTKEES